MNHPDGIDWWNWRGRSPWGDHFQTTSAHVLEGV